MKFLLLTAIEEEYLKARSYLNDLDEINFEDGSIFEEGRFLHGESNISVVLVKTGIGNIKSAIVSNNALSAIKPDYLFYVGIAGGIKDIVIGDVVFAEKFYYYENGKFKDKFYARPELGKSSYKLLQKATIESRKADWKNLCKVSKNDNDSKVIIGNICSGEKVVASTETEGHTPYSIIQEHYNDSHAIDMESGGLVTSTWIKSFNNIAIIRGISDMLLNKSLTDAQGAREKALDNAFSFAFHLVKKVYESEKHNTFFTISFNADETLLHEPEFAKVIAYLRAKSGDETLSFRFSSSGSINLHLTCKPAAYKILKKLFDDNEMDSISGFKILGIKKDDEEIIQQKDKSIRENVNSKLPKNSQELTKKKKILVTNANPNYRLVSDHNFTVVRQNLTNNQKAVFAQKNYEPGQLIAEFSAGEILSHPTYLTLQVDIDKHIMLKPEHLQYINHSCNPNVFFDTYKMRIVALKNISENEEMVYFYPSTEWDMAQPFKCHCGSSNCLGDIKGAAYISIHILKSYTLTRFIQQRILDRSDQLSHIKSAG